MVKSSILKKGFALVMMLVLICINGLAVMAAEKDGSESQDALASDSCWSCGNYSFYQTTEYVNWELLYKGSCVHGDHLSDIVETRNINQVIKCTYCHYTKDSEYIGLDSRQRCVDY